MGRLALFLIFVGVPIIEIALFIKVGGWLGLLPTLAIVILTALAGTVLMRSQGLQTLDKLRSTLATGGNPAGPIAHGALILIAGVLLLTPGFFTDATGLALLVPALRSGLIKWAAGHITVQTFGQRSGPERTGPSGGSIDAEYEVVPEPDDRRDRAQDSARSGWSKPQD